MQTKLQKTIMRRVYYSYTLSFLSESMLWQGLVLGACVALFGRLTHVASIARNLAHTSIENAPSFVFHGFTNAYTHGEVMTVLVTLFMFGITISFISRAVPLLLMIKGSRLQTA
jgi:hypothetical protein